MILGVARLDAPNAADPLLERRLTREPIAQITGVRDFWTLTLKVTGDVLTPRPDSETLIEAAIDQFKGRAPPLRILDLGVGSGALLLAALDVWREATGLGVDASAAALVVAQENARCCGMADRARFQPGDWCAGLQERFDLIFCNPPYIQNDAMLPADVARFEPASALYAGDDGLDAYRVLADQIGDRLLPGGLAVFEIGFDQGERAAALFRERDCSVEVVQDLARRPRCLLVRRLSPNPPQSD